MVKVELRLRTDKKKQPQGYPLYFYIRYEGKPRWKHTGIFAERPQYNEKKQQLRSSHPGGVALQQRVLRQALALQDRLTTAAAQGMAYEQAVQAPRVVPTLQQVMQDRIDELILAGDLGNARVYEQVLRALRRYDERDWPLNQVDYRRLTGWVAHMERERYAYATMRLRLATVRSVYEHARRLYETHLPDGDPFAGLLRGRAARPQLRVKHQPVEVIRKMVCATYPTEAMQRAADMWLLAFALQGAGFIDMLYFEFARVQQGYYPLQRLKMPKKNVFVQVKILPLAQKIIDRYWKSGNRYLWPGITCPRHEATRLPGSAEPEGSRQYLNAKYNLRNRLRSVSKHLQLSQNISISQARHSWVVAARDAGVRKEVIEQAIGHQGRSVLERHYYGRFPQKELDEANFTVLQKIN